MESVRAMKNLEIIVSQLVDCANAHRTRTVLKEIHVDFQRTIPAVLITQMVMMDMDAKTTNITVTDIQALGMIISGQLVKQRAIHVNMKSLFIVDLVYLLKTAVNATPNMDDATGTAC